MKHTSQKVAVNYQALATEFSVGDCVIAYGNSRDVVGRVVAVFPGIGMVDVQYPMGTRRHPVEELQRFEEGVAIPPRIAEVPGGRNIPFVSAGPFAQRVARRWMQKEAIYWAEQNRRYKATKEEMDTSDYKCPRCSISFKNTAYKRQDGKNVKLLACPECLFLIKPSDLIGCHLAPTEDVI